MQSNGFLINDDILWDYADGLLTSAERAQVDAYIAQNPVYQARLNQIVADRQALIHIPLDSPRAGFADKVMAAWVSEQVHKKAVAPADKRVLVFPLLLGGMLMAALVAVVAMVISSAATSTTTLTPASDLPQINPDILVHITTHPVTQIAVLGGFSLAFLGLLDRYLRLRFQKG